MTYKGRPLRRAKQFAGINARIAQLRAEVKALELERTKLLRSAEHEKST